MAVVFVGAAGDTLDLFGSEKAGLFGDGAGSGVDFGSLDRHQGGGNDRLRFRAQGNHAVVFEQYDAGRARGALDELFNPDADGLSKLDAGIGVGDQNAFGATTDHLVRTQAVFGEGPGMLRAEKAVDGDGMGVADKTDLGQGEQVGMECCFDRWLFGLLGSA